MNTRRNEGPARVAGSRSRWACLALAGLLAVTAWACADGAGDARQAEASAGGEVIVFHGMSDASAAIRLDDGRIVVADDETNVLRVYDRTRHAAPIGLIDLNAWLPLDPDSPEADLEAGARIGRRVYWMGSHGRNRNGRWRASRHMFFAMEINDDPAGPALVPVGEPYIGLAEAMADDENLRPLGLAEAIGPIGRRVPELAPKEQGFNIEGLAASPDGQRLYIGLRNPRPEGPDGRAQAAVVELLNPAAVVERGERPRFGDALLWDLEGLGIRSLEYSPYHRAYFVAAGAHDDDPGGVLYRWSGRHGDTPQPVLELDHMPRFRPEAIVGVPDRPELLLLSDDGAEIVQVAGPEECLPGEYQPDGTCLNKHLLDPARRTFRGVWIGVPEP